MRYLVVILAFILASSLALFSPVTQPALASNLQSPISNLQYTLQTTTTLPYDFQPIDFERPDLPTLGIDLLNVDFINRVGSMALTLFTIFDKYYVLGILMVIILALMAVFWLWRYVTELPSMVELKLSDMRPPLSAGEAINLGAAAYVGYSNLQDQSYIARQENLMAAFSARGEEMLYDPNNADNFVDNLQFLGTGREVIREDIGFARERMGRRSSALSSIRRATSLARPFGSSFRRARRDFGGNPFK